MLVTGRILNHALPHHENAALVIGKRPPDTVLMRIWVVGRPLCWGCQHGSTPSRMVVRLKPGKHRQCEERRTNPQIGAAVPPLQPQEDEGDGVEKAAKNKIGGFNQRLNVMLKGNWA